MSGDQAAAVEMIRALSNAGALQWYRHSLNNHTNAPTFVPFIVFRFEREHELFSERLPDVVNHFEGSVSWSLYFGGRNWALKPTKVREDFATGSWRIDSELHAHIARTEPDFCRLAVADLPELSSSVSDACQQLGEFKE